MTKLSLIVLLFGGILTFNGLIDKPTTSNLSETHPPSVASSVIQVVHAEKKPQIQAPKYVFNLESVNGLSLDDDVKTMIQKLGEPISQETDPDFSEFVVYTYPNMNIGFRDEFIDYVEVLVEAETVNIDGYSIMISEEGLISALGKPDFMAEDGIVFQREWALIKLFTNMETQKVTSLHYFHQSSI